MPTLLPAIFVCMFIVIIHHTDLNEDLLIPSSLTHGRKYLIPQRSAQQALNPQKENFSCWNKDILTAKSPWKGFRVCFTTQFVSRKQESQVPPARFSPRGRSRRTAVTYTRARHTHTTFSSFSEIRARAALRSRVLCGKYARSIMLISGVYDMDIRPVRCQ